MAGINDSETVKKQYEDSGRLNTRISIHDKYSQNKQGFGNWIFSHYDIRPDYRILELGCGTGNMWKGRLDSLPGGVTLYLTDFSEGMVQAAKNTLGERENVSYGVVDIEDIPFKSGIFDIVIANMMLYHVGDLDRGLSEVRRVLKDGGVFYCATYGENGIIPFTAGLLGVAEYTNKRFTMQNGNGILSGHFKNVTRLDYEDFLAVTDVNDLIDYIYSLEGISDISKIGRDTLKTVLEQNMTDGVLKVPKEYGMFVCR